jgi:hypothetical protein
MLIDISRGIPYSHLAASGLLPHIWRRQVFLHKYQLLIATPFKAEQSGILILPLNKPQISK